MTFRPLNGVLLALASVGVSILVVYSAGAQDAATVQKLERSDVAAPPPHISTNLADQSAATHRKSRVLQEIDRPMKGFSLNSSLDGTPAPPIPYQANHQLVPNKRLQEVIERRKEWIFMRPEDFDAPPTPEELMNLPEYCPDGQEKKKLSPLERFFEQFGQKDKNSKRTKEAAQVGLQGDIGRTNSPGGRQDDEDQTLPDGVRESAKKLRTLLGISGNQNDNSQSDTPGRSALSDIFGLGSDTELTPAQIRDHQEYMKQFQDLLRGAQPSAPLAGSLSGQPPPTPTPTPAGILSSAYGNLRPSSYDPTIGTVNPTYVPNVPSDINSRVLTQWNPMQTYSTAPEAPKTTPPALNPLVDFPRRKF